MTNERRTENGATLESSYLYDAIGQLTSFTRSDGISESYVYDPVGNMTAKTKNGVKTAMRYNAANQLISSTSGTDKTTYTYDANGNLVKSENAGGARSYAYNALGLLAKFTREDGYSESYTYNANRLLNTITTSDNLTTSLSWDILYGDGVVISENRNGEATNYTYGLERISAQNGKTRTEYVYDGRGSVAAEVSYNNAWYTFGGGLAKKETVSKSYTPFGELLTENVSGFGYNGEYYNAASGLIYLRARFYAPEMNRFSQKDILRGSIIQPGSLNRYAYCINDPVNFVDPSGMRYAIGTTVDDGWTHSSSAPAKTSNKSTSTSKGNSSSSSAKSSSSTASSARTSTSSSAYRGSYVAPGPVQSTASRVNPYNTMQSTQQAIVDAKRAADLANSLAPGSPAAYQAMRDYNETRRLAEQARITNNPYVARQAVETSQRSVNHVNNVVTGRTPNTYSPYDSHGNVYSYYNSSYDTGYIPSPDAPRIMDVDAVNLENCGKGEENSNQFLNFTQNAWEKVKNWAKSEQGQLVIDGVLTVASFAAIAVAVTVTTLNPVGVAVLLGAGVTSLVGGFINQSNGGSFSAGWLGGAISGALTGLGAGLASVALQGATAAGGSAAAAVAGFGEAAVKSTTLGTAGGFFGSIATQMANGEQVDIEKALSSGVINGAVAGLASPFTLVSEAIKQGVPAVGSAVGLIFETVFDSSSGYAAEQ